MDALATTSAAATLATVNPELVEAARGYVAASKAPATRRAYAQGWRAFSSWCASKGLEPMPAHPNTLALYAAELAQAGRKPSTVEKAVSAVVAAHGAAGHLSPRTEAVAATLSGIRRTHGTAPREAAPVLAGHLRSMLANLPATLLGKRDAALLLVGFVGALRRSELVALELRDVAFTDAGAELTLRRSKTDQEGKGRKVALPVSASPTLCPVRALKAWLEAAGIVSGPLFREVNRHGQVAGAALSGHSVGRIVKRAAAAAGLEPGIFSGHSLRAGFVTTARAKGAPVEHVMEQTGHKSAAMVARYDRRVRLWTSNAAVGLLD